MYGMTFTLVTLFPDMFSSPFMYSIMKRAQKEGLVSINFINIREYAEDKYKSVDDHPYGGGHGMIFRVDIVAKAMEAATRAVSHPVTKQISILLDPRGKTYTQKTAQKLCTYDHVILLCGHYEGIDERIRTLVDMEISIGDYVVTGGEIPAMAIVDSVTRLVPNVLSSPESSLDESFTDNSLEYPQYTKPAEYKGMLVPEVLLSGNHKVIAEWKKEQSKLITKNVRPDLVKE